MSKDVEMFDFQTVQKSFCINEWIKENLATIDKKVVTNLSKIKKY